jgi:hypothetical protein
MNLLGAFCAGTPPALIFCLGLWLVVGGAWHTLHRAQDSPTGDVGRVDGDLGTGRLQLSSRPPAWASPAHGDGALAHGEAALTKTTQQMR